MLLVILNMSMFVSVTNPPPPPPSLPLFTGSVDNVRLWDVSTQREVAVLEGYTKGVTSVAFDGSGKYLASGGAIGVMFDSWL